MKTSLKISIDSQLLAVVAEHAANSGTTVDALVEANFRTLLANASRPSIIELIESLEKPAQSDISDDARSRAYEEKYGSYPDFN
jgi:hypothetical protein